MRRAALIGLEYVFEFGFYFCEYRYLLCHICCIAALHRWLSGFIETLTTGKHRQLSEYNVIILFYFLLHRSIANWIAANVNNSPSCKTDALKTICVPRWAVTSWLWRCPQSLRICAFFILHLNDKQVNFVHDFCSDYRKNLERWVYDIAMACSFTERILLFLSLCAYRDVWLLYISTYILITQETQKWSPNVFAFLRQWEIYQDLSSVRTIERKNFSSYIDSKEQFCNKQNTNWDTVDTGEFCLIRQDDNVIRKKNQSWI